MLYMSEVKIVGVAVWYPFFKNPPLKAFTDINFVTRDSNKDVKI